MKEKRILILNSLYYPHYGGVENSIYEMTKSFHKKGYKVDLICSNSHPNATLSLPSYEDVGYYSIFRYNVKGCGYIRQIFNCLGKVKALLSVNSYDIIVSRGYVTSFCLAVLRADFYYLVPSVIYFQDKSNFFRFSMSRKIKYISSSLLQFIGINSSNLIVFSEGMKEQVSKVLLISKEINFCSFGIDSSKYFPINEERKLQLRRKHKLNTNKKYLLCLGRFSELKKFDLAIESLNYLNEDYHLLLVGDGPELNKYKKIISDFSLGHRVTIFGATTVAEEYYQLSDVFLMTSRYETFGQVLLEASASGLPIVAFGACTGVKTSTKKIYQGFDSLVKYSEELSAFSLSKTIISLEEHCLNKNELSKFLSRYSWDNLVLDIEEISK